MTSQNDRLNDTRGCEFRNARTGNRYLHACISLMVGIFLSARDKINTYGSIHSYLCCQTRQSPTHVERHICSARLYFNVALAD